MRTSVAGVGLSRAAAYGRNTGLENHQHPLEVSEVRIVGVKAPAASDMWAGAGVVDWWTVLRSLGRLNCKVDLPLYV